MNRTKNGFTVIEVSLVLALAGLIFLMVFVALPSLRRSQRDTSRRESAMKLVSEIKNYQSNNGRGNLPGPGETLPKTVTGKSAVANTSAKNGSWDGFYRDFLGVNYVDPAGEQYNLRIIDCGLEVPDSNCANNVNEIKKIYSASFPNNYRMYIILGSTCYGDQAVASSNGRMVSVLYRLEGAGVFCTNT